MTARLALVISTALLLSQAIWRVQATSPRQRADAAELALGWVCRMTYNDSTQGRDTVGGLATRQKVPKPKKRPLSVSTAGLKETSRGIGMAAGVSPLVLSLNDDGGESREALSLTQTRLKRTGEDSDCRSRPVVTLFLRMLGLPRLRTTPVELRP